MADAYYMILTKAGLEAYGKADAGGPRVEYAFVAVGDGGGGSVTPTEDWTALAGEKYRAAPILVETDPKNPRIATIELYIPHSVGGFTVREVGLLSPAGTLLAVGRYPDSYKPTTDSGAGKEMHARLQIEHSNAAQTILKIDPAIVMASREYADKTAKAQIQAHDEAGTHGGRFAAVDHVHASAVPQARKITTTGALTGGGTLDADLTLGVDIPASVPPMRRIGTTAPLTGGGSLDADLTLGIIPGPEGCYLTVENGTLIWKAISRYDLCEFYYFRHPSLRPGMQPAQGGLLANAATLYPEAWAYLQTTEGQKLCKTEAEFQAMTTATWATLADGTKVGWNGIGGAPFYAPNTATGALRLPDLRGMCAEAAGIDSLGVGDTHGDAIRPFTGTFQIYGVSTRTANGVFTDATVYDGNKINAGLASGNQAGFAISLSRQVPVAAKNQVRAWGSLACVYLGLPS